MASKTKELYFPVFLNYLINVEVTKDIAKSLKNYPRTNSVVLEENTQAICVHTHNEPYSYIFLPPKSSVGTIAHEAYHAVKAMMEYVGVELDSETVAHHLGFVVNEIVSFQKKVKL